MVRLKGVRRLFALAVAVLALATPVSAAALWMWEGVDGPITGHAAPVVPGALESASQDGTRPRTLVVTPGEDGSVDYVVVRGQEPRLGEERIVPAARTREAVDHAVATLLAGHGGEELHVLADFGVQYVLYPRPEIGGAADATMVDTLDGTPGLVRQSLSERYALWRVDEPTGALRVVSEDGDESEALTVGGGGDLVAELGGGDTGRRLALAESADGGWRATLDGNELTPIDTSNGTQAWSLPIEGGELRVWHTDLVHGAWLVTQAILFLVVVVLAAPGVRTEEEARLVASTPAPRPRRPERLRRSRRSRRGAPTPRNAGQEGGDEGGIAGPEPEEDQTGTGAVPVTGSGTETGAVPVTRTGGRRRAGRGTRRASGKPGRRRAGGKPATEADNDAGQTGTEGEE